MSENILSHIQNSYDFLTKTHKKIADTLLSDPTAFTRISMTELSKLTLASQGSINNFSKKFGANGFSDLKIKIASSAGKEDTPFSSLDKTSDTALKVRVNCSSKALFNTCQINSKEAVIKAAELILSAERIEIFGVYQSGIVARDLCYSLIELGIPAAYQDDILMGAVSSSLLGQKGLAIALSASGETKDIIDSVMLAKENGSKVLCITANRFSPLASCSDLVLLAAASGMSISDKNSEVRLSQLLLADTLCSYIRSIIDESGSVHYYKMQKILNSHSVKND